MTDTDMQAVLDNIDRYCTEQGYFKEKTEVKKMNTLEQMAAYLDIMLQIQQDCQVPEQGGEAYEVYYNASGDYFTPVYAIGWYSIGGIMAKEYGYLYKLCETQTDKLYKIIGVHKT